MANRATNPGIGALVLVVALCAPALLRAQQGESSPARLPNSTVADTPPPVTAPLEDRIASARSVRVMTSILGIKLGSELDEAHRKLDKLSAPGTPPKAEGGDDEEKEHDAKEHREKAGDSKEKEKHEPEIGEEREEGHKVLWQLAGTDYSSVYVTADEEEHIESITGFLRPEKQMTFDRVGDVSKAPIKDDHAVVWDVLRPGQSLFRVVARGGDGKVSSIRLFVVRRKSSGPFPAKKK